MPHQINTTATGRKDGHLWIERYTEGGTAYFKAYRKRTNGKVQLAGEYEMPLKQLRSFSSDTPNRPMLTMQQAAQMSLDVQDASNLSGVVASLDNEIMPALWEESRKLGYGTKWINTHPIVTLFIDKLASLNGTQEGRTNIFYSRAALAVRRLIGQPVAEKQVADIEAAIKSLGQK